MLSAAEPNPSLCRRRDPCPSNDGRRRQEASRARGQPTAFARVEEERRRRAAEAEARRAAAEAARLDGLSQTAARAAREREAAARLQAAAADCEALRARRAALLAAEEER